MKIELVYSNKYFSYIWEILAKIFGLLSTFVLIFFLNKEQLGDYSFIRSYILIVGALSLVGLQASSYRFLIVRERREEKYKGTYVWFSVFFAVFINILILGFLFLFEAYMDSKFPIDMGLVYLMQAIVAIYTVTTFYSVACKVVGNASKGFFISMLTPLLFFTGIAGLFLTNNYSLYTIIKIYGLAVFIVFSLSFYFIRKEYDPVNALRYLTYRKVKGWLSVSSSMWLSGFFPAFLTQGVVIFSGFYFSGATLGDIGLAVLVVANLAMFKEVGVAIFLPSVIKIYVEDRRLDISTLIKCFLFSAVPIILFIVFLSVFNEYILYFFGDRVSSDSVILMILLSVSQLFMGIYQPVFRLYSVVVSHLKVLVSSIFLFVFLIFMYYLSAALYDVFYVVYSTIFVSFMAVMISFFYLKGLLNE
jgi:O-antigen/teichoic acid export membrane protein